MESKNKKIFNKKNIIIIFGIVLVVSIFLLAIFTKNHNDNAKIILDCKMSYQNEYMDLTLNAGLKEKGKDLIYFQILTFNNLSEIESLSELTALMFNFNDESLEEYSDLLTYQETDKGFIGTFELNLSNNNYSDEKRKELIGTKETSKEKIKEFLKEKEYICEEY